MRTDIFYALVFTFALAGLLPNASGKSLAPDPRLIQQVGSYDDAINAAKAQIQQAIDTYGSDSVWVINTISGYGTQVKGADLPKFLNEIQTAYPNLKLDSTYYGNLDKKDHVEPNALACMVTNSWYEQMLTHYSTLEDGSDNGSAFELNPDSLFGFLRRLNTNITCGDRYLKDLLDEYLEKLRNAHEFLKYYPDFENTANKLRALFTESKSAKTKTFSGVVNCSDLRKYKQEILADIPGKPEALANMCGTCKEVEYMYGKDIGLYRSQIERKDLKQNAHTLFVDYDFPARCVLYIQIYGSKSSAAVVPAKPAAK